jgi:phenylalanyl-tRNA synthetase beta chain
LTEEQDTLRTSLLAPGLLQNLRTNVQVTLGRRDLAVFELGRVFARSGAGVREERRLAILLSGLSSPVHWSGKSRAFDLFDLKGLLEVLGERFGVGFVTTPCGAPPASFHPSRAFAVAVGGEEVGFGGSLHPDLLATLERAEDAVAMEIDLEPLLARPPGPVRFVPLQRFPPVTRDLSVLCEATEPAEAVAARVRAAAGPQLCSVAFVDRYTGRPVPPGKVSLTLALRFQDPERTLTGDEVQSSMDAVIRDLRAAGVEIRSE